MPADPFEGRSRAPSNEAALITAQSSPPVPAWLTLRPGVVARVDVSPWKPESAPEAEAALTASAGSIAHFADSTQPRPRDVVHEPIGVRVTVVRILGRVVRVRGLSGRWEAFTLAERLVPEVPPATALRAAGGFAGFAALLPSLGAAVSDYAALPTGARLVALKLAVAPYDPSDSNLVRLKVRVLSGSLRGRTGWLGTAYTGLPLRPGAGASAPERVCGCRLVAF